MAEFNLQHDVMEPRVGGRWTDQLLHDYRSSDSVPTTKKNAWKMLISGAGVGLKVILTLEGQNITGS